MILAGFPPMILPDSDMLLVTTLPAAIIELLGIVTPYIIIACDPIKQLSPILIAPHKSEKFSLPRKTPMLASCVMKLTSDEIVQLFPISIK